MKTINNQDLIAKKINDLKLIGVNACGDDGSVCIDVIGDRNHTIQVAQNILNVIGDVDTGDGVQTGGLFINNPDQNIHDDLFRIANLD